jgi:endonuclease/exonuclease/phosphatase (EEP) superfamily protein YafD
MKLNWMNKMFFIANIIVAIALLLASFSSQFDPSQSSLIYMFGLTYPALLLLNILFVFHWLYRLKIHILVSLLVILMGFSNLESLIALNTEKETPENAEFSIMSFNVRLFNRYNWLEEDGIDDEIFQYIESKDPDIVAFQEFINEDKSELFYIKKMKSLGYSFYERENIRYERDFFGLITFSKFKIIDSGAAFQYYETKGKTISLFTDIKILDQIIRVYNTHLNSLGFINEDYLFVENIGNQNETETIKKSKSILSKVLVAARKREIEVESIIEHITTSPYPVIVIGDFNEPPYSFSYPKFTKTLEDPFIKHEFGIGATFDGIKTIPGLRLDFILHSKELTTLSFETGPSGLSDHRPIISWFDLTK